MQVIPVHAVAEHMRALRWHESHLFGHSYTHDGWCVGIWPDGWTLSRTTAKPGVYEVKFQGETLSQLKDALRAAEIPQEEANATNH
jgi:hypothetical protein